METSVTIVSTNLNKELLKKYTQYHVIDTSFNLPDLKQYSAIIFFNVLNNIAESKVKEIFTYLEDNHINYINITNNMELSLFTKYLIIYDKENILIEGPTLEVLKNEKLIKRVGLQLPFIIELSLLLQDYGLVKEVYQSKEELKGVLWT